MTFIIYFFISKIIASENKSIAILKSIGYTDLQVSYIIFKFIVIDLIISFIISHLLYFIIQLSFSESIEKLININDILLYNSDSIITVIIIIILSSLFAIISNYNKINKNSPIKLFYEN